MSVDTDQSARADELVTAEQPVDGAKPMAPSGSAWRERRRLITDWTARLLIPLWRDWRIGAATAVGSGVIWGVLAAWWTPRGPLTTSEAIWSIVLSLIVGGVAGLAMRSRWAMLAAPVVFASTFELLRLGTDGPTVDGLHATTYGAIAFVVGRGFHALISLLPILFGASLGAATARQLAPAPTGAAPNHRGWLLTRRSVVVVAGVGLLAFTAALARPATTDSIVDADGNEVPGSIAELTTVDINGHELAMMIRPSATMSCGGDAALICPHTRSTAAQRRKPR